MHQGRPRTARGESFQEAIARWQLGMQTEVKRVSALPTAMFDACDPMLEARLAEATQGIFASLRAQGPLPDHATPTDDLHLEAVDPTELAELCRRLCDGPAEPPDLGVGAPEELIGVLVDLCHVEDPEARARAAALLGRHLGIGVDELTELTGLLAGVLGCHLQAGAAEAMAQRLAPLLTPHPDRAGEDAA